MTRRGLLALALCVAADAAFAQTPPAEALVVVVNAKNTVASLTPAELRNIYFGNTTYWPDNVPIRPYNRPSEQGAGYEFFKSVLKTIPTRYGYHWQARQLSGRGNPPEVLDLPADVVRRVAASPEGVSYLLASELPLAGDLAGVRTIPLPVED